MRFILALLLCAALPVRAEELRVISPGVISNSGLGDVAAEIETLTHIKVTIEVAGMGEIMNRIRTGTPAADVAMLPMDLAETLALGGGASDWGQTGTRFVPLGRVEIGLFKKPSAPAPDITTVEKLASAMRTASTVFYTDPATGSMQAGMSGRLLARPDFAGVHGQPIKGDAEPALRRGDGDDRAMGLGLIHGPHDASNKPTDNPYLVGMLPAELNMHMDMAAILSSRSSNLMAASAFVHFAVSDQMRAVWKAKGVDRY